MNEQELLEKYAAKTVGFRPNTFIPLLKKIFVHRDASGNRYELILTEVEESKLNKDIFDEFTLIFTSARHVSFPQGYFLLEHESLGEFPLLLVPTLSRNQERNPYCVYFSYRKEEVCD